MIRVACLLLLTACALAARAHASPLPSLRAAQLRQQPIPGAMDYEDRPQDLVIRTLMKFKRNVPADNRKLFVVKSPCQKDDHCAHTQLYEFDLFQVEQSVNGKGVYY